MLDELNTYLPIAAFCFNALWTKASKSTLWSLITYYFVDPNVRKCANECRYCSNWNVLKSVHEYELFLLRHCLSGLNHLHLQSSQNYYTFCCTLLAASWYNVNACCSFVSFSETERLRHQTMLFSFAMCVLPLLRRWNERNIYLVGNCESTSTCF